MGDKGKEVVMFWYLEAIDMAAKPRGGLFSALPPQHESHLDMHPWHPSDPP